VHIKKAIFLYNEKREFIRKYAGVTEAQKDLGINHSVVKKNASLNSIYSGYIFSFKRLDTDLN
jgi:hypothetical protein